MTDIPENAARARQMYSEGATTRDIIEETGLSHYEIEARLAGSSGSSVSPRGRPS